MDIKHRKGGASSLLITIIAIILVLGGGAYFLSRTEEPSMDKDNAMMKKDEKIPKEEGLMMGDEMMQGYTGNLLAGTQTPLLDFVKADYDKELKSGKLVVLYFYANWCPICKAEFPVMQSVFNELTTDKAIGFRVNYNDNETDAAEKALAKEFGVAYQHTKVFVKNGEKILKAPDGWDRTRYLKEINKALNS